MIPTATVEPVNLDLAFLRAAIAPAASDGVQAENATTVAEILKKRRYNPAITPPQLRPIYKLGEAVIATPGNLVSVTSAVKTGKSAVIGAMCASVMAPECGDADCLGFSSSNPKGFAALHFDSEQSPDDHWHQNARTMKRAQLQTPEPPAWFYSYCLTGLGSTSAWECVQEAVRLAAEAHGGIHSILIDGVADLVADVNDAAECNAFVASLHDLAIKHDCPIIGVIHFNPGGDKTRGHLGSQLERKAETNLRLDKADEVTSIWSDKQRRAPIPKGTGPCFQWSDEAGMHVSAGNRQAAMEAEEIERLTLLADEIFAEHPSLKYSEIVSTVKTGSKISERTAERRVSRMAKLKVIRKSAAGHWTKGV